MPFYRQWVDKQLNCALIFKNKILEKFNVQLIGANQEAIDKAEDREKFKIAMKKIGLIVQNQKWHIA